MSEKTTDLLENENDAAETQEDTLVITLSKPYEFEGTTHTTIDLSGLEDVTGATMSAVGRKVNKLYKGVNPAVIEMSLEYAQLMAATVTNLPLEFFKGLSAKDTVAVKGAVVGFLYSGAGED